MDLTNSQILRCSEHENYCCGIWCFLGSLRSLSKGRSPTMCYGTDTKSESLWSDMEFWFQQSWAPLVPFPIPPPHPWTFTPCLINRMSYLFTAWGSEQLANALPLVLIQCWLVLNSFLVEEASEICQHGGLSFWYTLSRSSTICSLHLREKKLNRAF